MEHSNAVVGPNGRRGIKAPPTTALFADSDANILCNVISVKNFHN